MPTYFGPRSSQPAAPRRAGRWMMMTLLCFGMLHVIGAALLSYHQAPPLVDKASLISEVGD